MRTVGISILFIVLFIALSLYAVANVPAKIQASIKADIEEQYLQNKIQGVDVFVDGRDVTLLGAVSTQDQLDSAIEIASHRPGVRVVMIEAVVESVPRAKVEPMPDSFNDLSPPDNIE